MLHLLELLDNHSLRAEDDASRVISWRPAKLADFVDQAVELLPDLPAGKQRFSFLANAQLSGLPYPCSSVSCRLHNATRTGHFAALYADQVAIQDPFSDLRYLGDSGLVRERLFNALTVILHLRPLFEANLITLARQKIHFCPECTPGIVRSGVADRIYAELHEELMNRVVVSYDSENHELILSGLDEESGHAIVQPLHDSRRVKVIKKQDVEGFYLLSKAHKRRAIDIAAIPIVEDLVQQSVYASSWGMRYLTNRSTDIRPLRTFVEPHKYDLSRAVFEGLTHTVPTVQHADWSRVVRLRREEGEAFNVYRDSLQSLLQELPLTTTDDIATAFDDTVRPHLHRIDRTIKIAQRTLLRDATSAVVFGAAAISIGLASGLLAPDAAQLFAQLGGAGVATRAAQKLGGLLKAAEHGEENDFFFLWRAMRAR